MIRRTLPALFTACVLFPVVPLAAEETPALAIVTGIAPGDLLNVRAAASPVGRTRTRLSNGAAVKNAGCGDFNNYQWCKVEVVDQPGVDGWVPARYLLAIDPEGTATAALPTLDDAAIKAEAANASAMAAAPEEGDTGGNDAAAAAVQSGNEKAGGPTAAVPPNLAARFGDSPAAGPDAERESAGLTAAESDAYRLAFAARAEATASARPEGMNESEAKAPDADAAPANNAASATKDEIGGTAPQEAAAAANVPTPTPRPDVKKNEPETNLARADSQDAAHVAISAPAEDNPPTPPPQIVALADPQPPAPAWDAAGEVPCARYVGQPMTRCRAGVKRDGDGKVDVTVSWPDGGTRIISFYDGKPAGANSRGEFRFTREGGLSMIRLGVSERFEITDALAFGD